MKKLLFFVINILFLSHIILAQNELDALRYSYYQYFASARAMGFANAMTGLGAESGSVINNPAAAGLIRKNTISMTPGILLNLTETDFASSKNYSNKFNFTINHFALLFTNVNSIARYKWI